MEIINKRIWSETVEDVETEKHVKYGPFKYELSSNDDKIERNLCSHHQEMSRKFWSESAFQDFSSNVSEDLQSYTVENC